MLRKDKYITIPQLAKHLGISRIAVYRKVRKGQIPAKRLGRIYLISSRNIERILGKEIDARKKHHIESAVRKTVQQYGDVLRWLGAE
jgi:excisionase family DNA binding protein